jgi:hypothetical protein
MDIHERNEKKLKSQIEEELIEDEFYKWLNLKNQTEYKDILKLGIIQEILEDYIKRELSNILTNIEQDFLDYTTTDNKIRNVTKN